MSGRVEKTTRHLSGVKCVVNTCKYYDQGNYCNASAIEIQSPNARSIQETDCTTFASKG